MRPQAFVIKYMPDLRRREPRNVGVVVTDGARTLSRFIGEGPDGDLLGLNNLPGFFESKRTYRSWWQHWKRTISRSGPDELSARLVPDIGANYVCELAMVELAGSSVPLEEFLREAWNALVAWEARSETDDDFPDIADRLILPFKHRPALSVWEDQPLPVRHTDRHGRLFEASLHFHYMIKNGAWTHMRRVRLSGPDTSTWNRVHLSVAQFAGLYDSPDAAHRDSNKVALVQTRDSNPEIERQMQEIERKNVTVVSVDDEAEASRTLSEIIG